MALDLFVTKNGKNLRLGYSTGTCATLATKAACISMFKGEKIYEEVVLTPKGIEVRVDILNNQFTENSGVACVIKDGGDDIDATHGMEIWARVSKIPSGIVIDGGAGIGRVTKPGLDQSVGAAAINTMPRKMIEDVVKEVSRKFSYKGGIEVIIYAPKGEEIAEKTFNPNLGIYGGISIIGTSGIVEPQSLKAISSTIKIEMKVAFASGERAIIATPGNYGEAFLKKVQGIEDVGKIKCSNFIGDTLNYGEEIGFEKILFVGHGGKFVKLAGGVMNTHSSFGDCRMEIMAAHTGLFSMEPVAKIMEAVTVDQAVEVLNMYGLREVVMESIVKKAEAYLDRKTRGKFETGIIMFSNIHGVLAIGENGKKLLEDFGGYII